MREGAEVFESGCRNSYRFVSPAADRIVTLACANREIFSASRRLAAMRLPPRTASGERGWTALEPARFAVGRFFADK